MIVVRPDAALVIALDPASGAADAPGATLLDALEADVECALQDGVRAVVVRLTAAPAVSAAVARLGALERLSSRHEAEHASRRLRTLLTRLAGASAPVVAVISGTLEGAAAELALACHARVAGDAGHTGISFGWLDRGLIPAAGSVERLFALAGPDHACSALLGGGPHAGATGRFALIDHVARGPSDGVEAAIAAASSLSMVARSGRARPGVRQRITRELRAPILRAHARAAKGRLGAGHARAVDLLAAAARAAERGSSHAHLEHAAFAELATSSVARRLAELAVAMAERDPAASTRAALGAERLRAACLREIEALVQEGCEPLAIDRALGAWGSAERTGSVRGTAAFARRAVRPTTEEIQLRCQLRVVNEAALALMDGCFQDATEADVFAVREAGFPAFRGGPLRYVDTLGAREVVKRLEHLAAHFGGRFAPAPMLVDAARRGARLRGSGVGG